MSGTSSSTRGPKQSLDSSTRRSRQQAAAAAAASRGGILQSRGMDDFGSILERDYGFNRQGRVARKSSSRSNSGRKEDHESGRRQFSQQQQDFPYRVQPSSYGGAKLGDSFGSSHSLYDDIFSCNAHSTIPWFEDVFSSSRIKVSEFRDNDIFRGMPVLRKTSSRVTYEDIFHESPPDDPSSLFVFTDAMGSRVATSSRASSSGRQSPAQAFGAAKRESTTSSKSSPRPAEPRDGGSHSAAKVHGSFLSMSRDDFPSPGSKGHQQVNGYGNEHNHHLEAANGVSRSWMTVDTVSLLTRASDNPPPVRLAPATAHEEEVLETSLQASGPPPLRAPPPPIHLLSDDKKRHSRAPSLEQVVKDRCMVEESATEKVLAWQRHNLAQQFEPSTKMGNGQAQDSQRSVSFKESRTAVEKIVAEVQRKSPEFAQVGAERVMDRERNSLGKAEETEQPEPGTIHKELGNSVTEEQRCEDTSLHKAPVEPEVIQETRAVEVDEERASQSVDKEQDHTEVLTTDEDSKIESDMHREMKTEVAVSPQETVDKSVSPDQTPGRLNNESSSSYAESSIGIDTISSAEPTDSEEPEASRTKEQLDVEAAPETPERLEIPSHKKSSSEEAIEAAWKEDGHKVADEELERQNVGRSLAEKLTAEVWQRDTAKAIPEKRAKVKGIEGSTRPRPTPKKHVTPMVEEASEKLQRDSSSGSSARSLGSRVSLRDQLAKERQVRLKEVVKETTRKEVPKPSSQNESEAQRLRDRTLVEIITAEVRERQAIALAEKVAAAKLEEGNEEMLKVEKAKLAEKERREKLRLVENEKQEKARAAEKERLEKLEKARLAEKERLEKIRLAEKERLGKLERERERERLEKEQEREREIEREKDRTSRRIAEQIFRERERKLAEEKAQAEAFAKEQERIVKERAAVERATSEARARAERAAYEKANGNSRSTSVPRHSVSMPTSQQASENAGIRRTPSNLDANSQSARDFQETPERRKARLERYQRTMDRAARALAQKNQRDMELQSEQAERQRLAERLNSDIKRWSVGKDGNIRALLSTLQYVLAPESGWKQVSLTELISSAAVKKAYRRAALCVHPDKMQQKHASVQEKYIAEKVFHILQVAWNKFNSEENI